MSQANKKLDNLKFEMAEEISLGTKIKVIGVGGAARTP